MGLEGDSGSGASVEAGGVAGTSGPGLGGGVGAVQEGIRIEGEGCSREKQGVSASDLARAWDVSRAYVSKLVKRGCPLTSVEAATQWRVDNAKYGVGYRSKKGAGTLEKASLDKDKVRDSSKKEKKGEDAASGDSEGLGDGVDRVLDSLQASLRGAISVEEASLKLVDTAMLNGGKNLESLIRAYNHARDGRMDSEKRVREELQLREVLVPMAVAKKIGRRGYDAILPLLRALPKVAAPLVNPEDPVGAAAILQREVEGIIERARREYEPGGGGD